MPSIKTNVKVKMDVKGLKDIGKKLIRQKDMAVEVGHFDSKKHAADVEETIAGISLINQEGNSKIPARPYMAVALQSPAFMAEYKKALFRIAKGKSTIAKELPKLGRFLRDVMMGVIQVGGPGFPGNSIDTIARKGSSSPLIETATMVNDIESRLVKDLSRKRVKGLNTVTQ